MEDDKNTLKYLWFWLKYFAIGCVSVKIWLSTSKLALDIYLVILVEGLPHDLPKDLRLKHIRKLENSRKISKLGGNTDLQCSTTES